MNQELRNRRSRAEFTVEEVLRRGLMDGFQWDKKGKYRDWQ